MAVGRAGGLVRSAGTLKRRGLLAGAAALVAGGLARLGTTSRVEAAHGAGADLTALHIGASNTQSNGTITTLNGAVGSSVLGIRNVTASGGGLTASGSTSSLTGGYGVRGICGDSVLSDQPPHVGVHGMDLQHGAGVGVRGDGTATGVLGRSSFAGGQLRDGTGVRGESSGGTGVRGDASGGTGVRGVATGGTGIYGQSNSGLGAVGSSGGNIGVYGASSSNVGVFGDADVNTAVMGRTGAGIGVYGTATRPGQGGRAAVFDGTVLVNGPFTVVGGPKSAGVRHPDGTTRRMYCQESPEPYFEDVGRATLTSGRAEVALDPDFDAVVKGDDYDLFHTPYGQCNGLCVVRRGPHRFVVEELGKGTSGVQFGYRVMARRLDHVGARMEKVDVRPAQSRDI